MYSFINFKILFYSEMCHLNRPIFKIKNFSLNINSPCNWTQRVSSCVNLYTWDKIYYTKDKVTEHLGLGHFERNLNLSPPLSQLLHLTFWFSVFFIGLSINISALFLLWALLQSCSTYLIFKVQLLLLLKPVYSGQDGWVHEMAGHRTTFHNSEINKRQAESALGGWHAATYMAGHFNMRLMLLN